MAASTGPAYAQHLIGFWDFLNGGEDTGLADGIAQNGHFHGDAHVSGGALQLDGNCDYFDVSGEDMPFDLDRGTLEVAFNQGTDTGLLPDLNPDTLVNRGEWGDAGREGHFNISVTCDGQVQATHFAGTAEVFLTTDAGFFSPGDDVQVRYSWDADSGARLTVTNASTGAEQVVESDVTGLSMDIGDNDDENFTFGAREFEDGLYDQYFGGSIQQVAIYDTVIDARDGYVEGTAGNDTIDADYTGDPEGDMIDNGDAILPGEAPDDDIVLAGAGNDTVFGGLGSDDIYGETGDDTLIGGQGGDRIHGGTGNDTLYGDLPGDPNLPGEGPGDDLLLAGAGDDTVFGGLGSDRIYGGTGNDTLYGDGDESGSTQTVRESFEWNAQPEFHDGADVTGFTQNTGNVDVTFSVLNQHSGAETEFEDDGQYVDGIESGGESVDHHSALQSELHGGSADYRLNFSDEVRNISFRINDIDGDGTVRVTACDADGNPVAVTLSGGDDLTLTDTDGVAGADTASSAGGYDSTDDPDRSVLVEIAGPVSRIEIAHDQDGPDNSGITFTDVYFDAEAGGDIIYGEAGDDTISGGDGADLLHGGDDRDTFVDLNAGDTVDGGDGGNDHDTLDLTGAAPAGGSLRVTVTGPDSDGNGQDGYVTFLDADGEAAGRLDFTNIEEIVPCFTPGTLIATPEGERPVEQLRVGDRVITRDNGIQRIRWSGAKALDWRQLRASPHLKPVLIREGSLGNGLPERDMMVSPNHRMLVAGARMSLYFEESEVLVAAKHLAGTDGVHEVETLGARYLHFMFDRHEVVLANGAWTESFQPGDYSLRGMDEEQRGEILEIFPRLMGEGGTAVPAARRTLKRHEARLLAEG